MHAVSQKKQFDITSLHLQGSYQIIYTELTVVKSIYSLHWLTF